jgi:hypothetical protein
MFRDTPFYWTDGTLASLAAQKALEKAKSPRGPPAGIFDHDESAPPYFKTISVNG